MKLLVNGQLHEDASTLPYSNSLLRGDGLFETILTIDQKAVAWERHFARLEKSAKQIGRFKSNLKMALLQLLEPLVFDTAPGVVGKSSLLPQPAQTLW